MPPSLDEVIDQPEWICFGLRPEGMQLHFSRVNEQSMDSAVFLGHRKVDALASVAYPIADVFAALPEAPSPPASRFILHTAFCCSTLLARCIDVPGKARTLRELPVFSGLAGVRHALRREGHEALWSEVVTVVDRLSSRPFEAGSVVVNKPSNVFLPVASDFLDRGQASRALVIHSDLPAFLVSCCKKQSAGTQPWRDMYAALDPTSSVALDAGIDVAQASALELACLVWNAQMQVLLRLAGHAGQLRQVASATFLSSPIDCVRQAHAWLGIAADDGARQQVVEREMQLHAKQPGLSFDPQRREAEKLLVLEHFGSAIDDTIQWNRIRFGDWEAAYAASAGALPALAAE